MSRDQNLSREAIYAQERETIATEIAPTLGSVKKAQALIADPAAVVPTLSERKVEALLRCTSDIADQAVADFDTIRPERDKIALSLALYGLDPEGEDGPPKAVRGLSTKLGLSRQRIYEMRTDALGLSPQERTAGPSCPSLTQSGKASSGMTAKRACGCEGHWLNNHSQDEIAARAASRGVPKVPGSFGLRKLHELAERVLRAEERGSAARDIRDDIIRATDPEVWQRDRLAGIIGRNPSQISRIRGRQIAEEVPA